MMHIHLSLPSVSSFFEHSPTKDFLDRLLQKVKILQEINFQLCFSILDSLPMASLCWNNISYIYLKNYNKIFFLFAMCFTFILDYEYHEVLNS